MTAVELEDVTKTYGAVTAVNKLSLQVPAGTIYGFIGPNGSGKSTTLRMIMRILLPDQGRIRVLGAEGRGAANDRIGYLPEERGLYKKMKVRDVLCFHAGLKNISHPRPIVDDWLERFGLASWADKRIDALSKGMAQKVQFIATIAHRPELVILDEPFSGLDPVNTDLIRDTILEIKRSGATIIFSTHEMSVAERLCDFIFMIFRGRKVLDGSLAEIQEQHGEPIVHLRLADPQASLAGLAGVTRIVDHGNTRELWLQRGTDTQALLAALMQRATVERFEIARPSLHDIFVRIASPAQEHAHDA